MQSDPTLNTISLRVRVCYNVGNNLLLIREAFLPTVMWGFSESVFENTSIHYALNIRRPFCERFFISSVE